MKRIILSAAFSLSVLCGFSQFNRIDSIAGIEHLYLDEHVMGGGAAFFDYNNDGHLDIYVNGGEGHDRLYKNNGDKTFSDVSTSANLTESDTVITVGVSTGDINNDGYRDLLVTTGHGYTNLLYLNNGDGTFNNISSSAGINNFSGWSTSATFGDYNLDGYLDIYIGNYVETQGLPDIPFHGQIAETLPNQLFLNNGDNTFNDVSSEWLADDTGACLAVSSTDYDMDGDVDIYVANDFGDFYEANAFLENNDPIDGFTNVAVDNGSNAEINAMGVAIGDYDEDGDLDYYITNMMENYHYQNNDGRFTVVSNQTETELADLVSWGAFFFDYDHDTKLDLFVSNGGVTMMQGFLGQANVLYSYDQDDEYTRTSEFAGDPAEYISRGAIFGDIDYDGDLDMFVVNINDVATDASCELYENTLESENNWLMVDLVGTEANRDGFGAQLKLYAGERTLIREVDGGSTYLSQSASTVHYGLGDIDLIDSLEISWPGGDRQMAYKFYSNQYIKITQGVQWCDDNDKFECDGSCKNDEDQDGVCDDDEVEGCTDSMACNYNSEATEEDDSCVFLATFEIEGETQPHMQYKETYSYDGHEGSSYLWSTSANGTVTSGQGTGEAEIAWGMQGEGFVAVIETTGENCSGAEVRLDIEVVLGDNINEVELLNLQVYPNPAEDIVNISSSELIQSIELFDTQGRVVFSMHDVLASQMEISIEDLPSGIYKLRIIGNNKASIKQLYVK